MFSEGQSPRSVRRTLIVEAHAEDVNSECLPAESLRHGPARRHLPSFAAEYWKPLLAGLGGMMLMAHFWRIGFLPSLSFSDLGTVLAAFVLYVLGGLLLLACVLVLPSIAIARWVDASLLWPPPKRVQDAKTRQRKGLVSLRFHPCPRERGLRARAAFGLRPVVGSRTWFLLAALWTLALYALLMLAIERWPDAGYRTAALAIYALSLGIVALATLCCDRGWMHRRLRRLRKPVPQFLLLSTLYLAIWPLLLVFLQDGGLSAQVNDEPTLAFGLVVVIFLPLSHWLWYVNHRATLRQSAAARFAPLAMLVLYSGSPMLLVDEAAQTFGFGMLRDVDLVLTARGCEIAHTAWPKRTCRADSRGRAGTYRLERIDVLTRLGGDYYIAPAGGLDDDQLPRFTLPAEEVMSWSRPPEDRSRHLLHSPAHEAHR